MPLPPRNPLLRFGHGIYFGKIVPLIGGALSDRSAYRYLPKSLAYLPEPSVMLDRLRQAGFSGVQRRLLLGGAAQLIVGTKQGMIMSDLSNWGFGHSAIAGVVGQGT